ncbi:MAG: alpha/beta hydrolase [Cyanobacteria bacterium J06607_13]
MFALWQLPILVITSLYQAIACAREDRRSPPGRLIDVGGHRLHLVHLPPVHAVDRIKPTVVIEHSLGGVEGYVLAKEISRVAEVCLCDRAGYGWSEVSWRPATSAERVKALDRALTKANISPPYILVGNSLGSYHMRLYAQRFPEKVAGLVLTDGLHERAMLKMPRSLRLLQLLFLAGFVMSVAGSALGLVRVAARGGLFEWLKPELRQAPSAELGPIVRSFCRPKHWFTMAREIVQIDNSGRQLKGANEFGAMPIVNIRAACFFKRTWMTRWLPLGAVERLRSQMHDDLMTLSTRCAQLPAARSSHFVWIDQPEVIVQAVELLLLRLAPVSTRK